MLENKSFKLLILILVGILLTFLTLSKFQILKTLTVCEVLEKNLEEFATTKRGNPIEFCREMNYIRDSTSQKTKQFWVGGKLLNITRQFNEAYDSYEFKLKFRGLRKEVEIYTFSFNPNIPYEIGKFYKFDAAKWCETLFSTAHSGFFRDHNFTLLEEFDECNK